MSNSINFVKNAHSPGVPEVAIWTTSQLQVQIAQETFVDELK